MEPRMILKSKDRSFLGGATVCAALTVALIWVPFGFAQGGLIEEWEILGLVNSGANVWWISPASALGQYATRPLTVFPMGLAYVLSPNSFFGWHVLMITELIIKGVAAAYLIRQAVQSDLLGVLGAVIAIAYPADTMTIAIRGVHINFAMMLLLVGASLNVADLTRDRSRRLLSMLGAASALAAFLIYEATLPLIILPLMVVFIRFGVSGTLQNVKAKAASHAIWFLTALTYVIYALFINHYIPQSYQSSIFPSSADTVATFVDGLKAVFTIAYPRLLWAGWYDGVSMLLVEMNLHTAMPLLFAVATVIWLIAWRCRAASDPHGWPLIRALIAGLIIMIAGYLPYALLPSHRAISQRTFMWAALGASFFIVGLLGLFVWRRRFVAAYLVFTAFIVPSLAFMLVQHDHYVELSKNSKRALASILAQIDPVKTNVVIDKTNSIGHTWNLLDGVMQPAIAYLRDTPQQIYILQVCRATGMEWERSFPLGRHGDCRQEATDWRFVSPVPVSGPGMPPPAPSADLVLPKNQTHTVIVGAHATSDRNRSQS